MTLLDIRNLSVEYHRHGDTIRAVRNVSFAVAAGETLALVGESGCGKSTMALAIPGLIFPGEGKISSGEVIFDGTNLRGLSFDELRQLRGKEISIILQDPFSSLNPVMTVREQLEEAITAHFPAMQKDEIATRCVAALGEVRLDDPERILGSYPHRLSGGQRQRVAIAMALINRPRLLIADEPTTALDVTIQKDILDLLVSLKNNRGLTMIIITHNLPLAAAYSDRIAVMYAGEIVETAPSQDIISASRHPYTRALMRSVPRLFVPSNHEQLAGQPPDLSAQIAGCSFRERCPVAFEPCGITDPQTVPGTAKCFRVAAPEAGR